MSEENPYRAPLAKLVDDKPKNRNRRDALIAVGLSVLGLSWVTWAYFQGLSLEYSALWSVGVVVFFAVMYNLSRR
jgi:drug/metabolite transporter (DMT)-like permease